MRLVRERGWTAERLQDGLSIVVESARRGVRGAQIKQRLSRSTVPGESFAQAVGIEVPVRAVSEHFASVPRTFTGTKNCSQLIGQSNNQRLLGFRVEG